MVGLLAWWAGSALAEEASFDVRLAGLKGGVLAYSATESGGSYKAQGSAQATGLAGQVFTAKVDVAANGGVRGNRYAPRGYVEHSQTKRGVRKARFTYKNGVPDVKKDPPDTNRQPYHANPVQQKGTVDPLTAAFAILRDRSDALVCDLDIQPYDGRERTHIRLSDPQRDGDTLLCQGRYSRISGFSDAEMARQVHWNFTVSYQWAGDVWQVHKVRVPTSYGVVSITRR